MKADDVQSCEPCPPSAYPYGLRLCLNDDQCEALGIKGAVSTGTVVGVSARAVVVKCTEQAEVDGDDKGADIYLDLQITDMALTPPPSGVDASKLYSNSSMGD